MRLLLILVSIFVKVFAISRVRRQWGPTDFYQFEQWVNYVNRPRHEFSGDAPGYQMNGWGTLERNIQPHSAPPGWSLNQRQGYGGWGIAPSAGYGYAVRQRPVANKPPVVIETNVFRTSDNTGFFPSLNGYVMPPRGFEETTVMPTISTVSTTTEVTTTSLQSSTTEDERERFIQKAVREDMDNENAEVPSTTMATTESLSTEETSTETTTTEASSTVSVNSFGFASELPSVTTDASSTTSNEIPSSSSSESTTETSEGFSSADYSAVWSEEGPTTLTAAETTETFATTEETSRTDSPSSTTFFATMEEIPEKETEDKTEGATTTLEQTTPETTTETATVTSFLTELFSGLRAPPLPVDVSKKLRELGMSIEKQ